MFKTRQQRLHDFIEEQQIAGVVISRPVDIWWLTGFQASFAYLVVFRTGQQYLITDSRYEIAGQKASKIAGASFVLYGKEILAALFEKKKGKILVQPSMTMGQYDQWKRIFASGELSVGKSFMRSIRREKSKAELNTMRIAQSHVDSLLPGFISEVFVDGITEKEATFRLEMALRQKGEYGLSFDPIVAFGANSALPHHHGGDTKLEKNMPILIDCGVTYDGYCSDMTRNAFYGNVTNAYECDYNALLKAQEVTLKQCISGMEIKKLAEYCREQMGELSDFFTHSLGHGVGAEIHESPSVSVRSEETLQDGDVITIEPGIYREGQYGIRIEDILVINGKNPEVLSTTQKELFVLPLK